MPLRWKLTLMVVLSFVVLVVCGLLYTFLMAPVDQIRKETSFLQQLKDQVLVERATLNHLPMIGLDEGLSNLQEAHDATVAATDVVKNLKVLGAADKDIAQALTLVVAFSHKADEIYPILLQVTDNLKAVGGDIGIDSRELEVYSFLAQPLVLASPKKLFAASVVDQLRAAMKKADTWYDTMSQMLNLQFDKINGLVGKIAQRATLTAGSIVVVIVLSSFFLILFMAGRVSRTIVRIGAEVQALKDGDLTRRFTSKNRDEVGQLGRDMDIFLARHREVVRNIQNVAAENHLVKEDLDAAQTQAGDASHLLDQSVNAVEQQMEELKGGIQSFRTAIEVIDRNLSGLTSSIERQNGRVQDSTAAVNQMQASIDSIHRLTKARLENVRTLVEAAQEGGTKLDRTNELIRTVNTSVTGIQEMADLISQIAGQTNLLAMNAAIEAAHAGESGKGFSVVADEIRKLAEASSENSNQITATLNTIVSTIGEAFRSSADTSQSFLRIQAEIQEVAQALDEIASQVNEFSLGGQQIHEAMAGLQDVSHEVDQGNREMAQATQTTNAVLRSVEHVAGEVADALSHLGEASTTLGRSTLAVDGLLGRINSVADSLSAETAKFKTE